MMITVAEAAAIIMNHSRHYGVEELPFRQCLGRILAQDITTDRDLPPYNRSTMDGIAIRHSAFANGTRAFTIIATVAAGEKPVDIVHDNECIELMTGSPVPGSLDTVVRYEDLSIVDGTSTVNVDVLKPGQNIHLQGRDKKQGDIVVPAGRTIDATITSMAASVGNAQLRVKKLPRTVIITTGNELVDVADTPEQWQIRRSNNYAINAMLATWRIVADMRHLPDDYDTIETQLRDCLATYDVLLLSGGVSMGKFDHVPAALAHAGVTQHFHKVQQRPGKPLWFGTHGSGAVVFAFPGNPVSAFMCLNRYFVPWLQQCLETGEQPPLYAVLNSDVVFAPALQYFVQVRLHTDMKGQLLAALVEGNGSGDFANLLESDAFMELPLEQTQFRKGEVYRVWPFKKVV